MQQASLCLWAPLSTQPSCTTVLWVSLHSHPAQSSHTAILWASLHSRPTQPSSGPLSSALPPLQPLLCSPAVLQPCHPVVPRALGGALFTESTVMYCPQVCSELVNQGQVRILTIGTLILSTLANGFQPWTSSLWIQ